MAPVAWIKCDGKALSKPIGFGQQPQRAYTDRSFVRAVSRLICIIGFLVAPACLGFDGGEARAFVTPSDLAPGAGGFYVTDRDAGTVSFVTSRGVEVVAEGWQRPFGVTRLADGRVCVSHLAKTDERIGAAMVSCLQDGIWTTAVVTEASGINGLTAAGHGFWMAGWIDTPAVSPNGLIALVQDGAVVAQIELGSYVPRFIAVLPDDALLVTVARVDASGVTSGAILHVHATGSFARFETLVGEPTGIEVRDGTVWFADARAGSLIAVDMDGSEVHRYDGLTGPSGIAFISEAEVCVADTLGRRVKCFEFGAPSRR